MGYTPPLLDPIGTRLHQLYFFDFKDEDEDEDEDEKQSYRKFRALRLKSLLSNCLLSTEK
jgi:hypothetical protein